MSERTIVQSNIHTSVAEISMINILYACEWAITWEVNRSSWIHFACIGVAPP